NFDAKFYLLSFRVILGSKLVVLLLKRLQSYTHGGNMVALHKCFRRKAMSKSLQLADLRSHSMDVSQHLHCIYTNWPPIKANATNMLFWPGYFIMGNKPVKQERREEVLLKIVPPLDQAYVRWLARDIERIHGFSPRNPRAVKPPEHYIEYMQLNGWLDVDLDDPDLAHLFK
ncbi:hypothetical protein Goari_016229, partial [Gossypium aridum]|nr:hypothetical protein [Gossypium aridum]